MVSRETIGVGARVRLYELPYCRNYWDGIVIGQPRRLVRTLSVSVRWDDGLIADAPLDRLELLEPAHAG